MHDLSPTLRAGGHHKSHANGGVAPAIAFTQNSRSEVREIGGDGQIVGALAADAGAQQQNYIAFAMRGREAGNVPEVHGNGDVVATTSVVRRLTPKEAERLMGFPDGYTQVPVGNKPTADGPRYKQLGNSMAVPVMAWIGQRIAMLESLNERAAA
jgi:DNA (cytosine-5)-methyltransferase 1